MASSNDKINYNLRPSKSIERKMILEVLKEICSPLKAADYQYIGMGSAFFVDFKLFHKSLGINEMFSFEGKKSNVNRCSFNKPFDCIEIIPERTEKGLTEIDWETKKSIVWLDYEDELRGWMINDIDTVSQNAKSGNVLIITLRRTYEKDIDDLNKEFSDYILNQLTLNDMHIKNSANSLKTILSSAINNKLIKAFSVYPADEKIDFCPLFEFTYEDGAAMFTFGGIFLNENDKTEFQNYKFHDLEFMQESNRPYSISCPIITDKEFHLLNAKLPTADVETFSTIEELEIVPKIHRENYFRTYKYYPNYFEIWI